MPQRSKFARSVKENGKRASPPPAKCLSQKQVREILDWGFTIVRYGKSRDTFISAQEYDDFVSEVQNLNEHIFNNAPTGKGDGTRLQSVREWDTLPGKAASIVSRRIQSTFPHLQPGDAQFLLSIANGHDQLPHTDVTAGHGQLSSSNVKALHNHIREDRSRQHSPSLSSYSKKWGFETSELLRDLVSTCPLRVFQTFKRLFLSGTPKCVTGGNCLH